MEEAKAIIGILLISALAFTSYLVVTGGSAGAVISQPYQTCCCNILVTDGSQQLLVRNQVQTFAPNCDVACSRYQDAIVGKGVIFPQEGLCAENP